MEFMDNKKYNELLNQAIFMLKKDGPETVFKSLDDSIKQNPNFLEAYLVRGEIYTEKGDYEESLSDFEKAIKIDPSIPQSYFLRGMLYIKLRNDINKAFSDFNKAIELDSKYAAAYSNRGNMYLKMREPQKAIDDCTKAIELSSVEMEPYFNRGLAYANLGEFKKSLDDYNMVIKIDPKNVEALAKRGLCHSELGNIQEAISDFEKFLELDPNNKNADLVRDALKNLGNGKKINDNTDKKKILNKMIIGCVIGAIIVGSLSSFNWLGFVIGAFLGLGFDNFWKECKEEIIISFGALFNTLKKMSSDDVAEKGFLQGGLLGIFVYTPLRFLLGVVMFLFWPGLKLYFKLIISPFITINNFLKA